MNQNNTNHKTSDKPQQHTSYTKQTNNKTQLNQTNSILTRKPTTHQTTNEKQTHNRPQMEENTRRELKQHTEQKQQQNKARTHNNAEKTQVVPQAK